MALHMQYRETRFGSWVDYDLAENGVAIKSILFSYSSASRADWYVTAAEHTQPIPALSWVKIWDDVGTDDNGDPLTDTNPLFLGIVISIAPGDHSNQVRYVALDPTYLAAKSVTVMSLPYDSQIDKVNVPATGAVPRLVYNCKNTADEDYSYQVAQDSTVAQLISGLLDYCNEPLYWLDAAQSTVAYDAGDLLDMTFIPQEKIVWESVTVRAAVEQLWRCEPRFRMFFHPTTSLWRFYKLTAGPAVTLPLNDNGLVNPYPVIGAQITPSYEDCQTAVSIYGPPNVGAGTWYWDDTIVTPGTGNLVPLGSPTFLQNYSDGSGMHTAECYTSFQIFDTDKRAGSRTLKDWTIVPTSTYQGFEDRFPVFLCSWDHGTTWQAMKGVWLDFLNGTVTFQGGIVPFLTITDNGAPVVFGSTQTIFPPNAFQLVWAPYEAPLQVRYPASGFSGTGFDVFGIENEFRLYDESLAIGREYGTPVTSVTREAQYSQLAEFLHEARRDVAYTGSIVIAGCDYQYCRLNKRVNLSDAAGATTGWEDMNAVVTDVEYTYGDDPATTLTFNGNWLDLYGEDPAALRERLRIQSFTQYTWSQIHGLPISTLIFGKPTQNYNGSWSQNVTGISVKDPFVYVDQYGNQQSGGIS